MQGLLNNKAAEIHQENIKKGIWDERAGIPAKMKLSKTHIVTFDPEEIAFAKGAILSQMIMLTVSELSEAQEALRKDRRANLEAFNTDIELYKDTVAVSEETGFVRSFNDHIKDTFEDELADAVIRLLDLAAAEGIDLEKHIELKRKFNKTRPYKHGKNS